MASGLIFYLSESEYQEKRFEAAKSILASAITAEQLGQITEEKKRESMIFNCILLTDALLEELGYVCEEGRDSKAHMNSDREKPASPDATKIRSLKSIFESNKE